jgi:transcriptional regulator with XRE-family HTH domain
LTRQQQSVVRFTDLGLADELSDKEFRDQFFRSEREIDIPAQIKALRKFRGLTQKQLAEKAGTKQSAISRIERSEESNWEIETLVKIAEALDSRLALVFEPYEIVASQYRNAAQASAPSAATAGVDEHRKTDQQLECGAQQEPAPQQPGQHPQPPRSSIQVKGAEHQWS